MRTDFNPIPRMDYGGCVTHRPYSFFLCIALCVFSIQMQANSTNTACISDVNITLSSNGTAQLHPSMFSRAATAGWTVAIDDDDLVDPTLANCTMAGSTVMVIVTDNTGSICMSRLHVEDKSDYTVVLKDTIVNCTVELDSIKGLILDVVDNCTKLDDLNVSYIDVENRDFVANDDTLALFVRNWIFTDKKNVTVYARSLIALEPFDIDDVLFPPNITLYCPDDPTDLELTGVPSYYDIDIKNMCGVASLTRIDDGKVQDCNTNLKYIRQWILNDWNTIDTIHEQVITVVDTFKQKLSAPELTPFVLEGCQFGFEVIKPNTASLGCSKVPDELLTVEVNNTIVSVGDTIQLNFGDTAFIRYTGRDDCWNELIPVLDTLTYNEPNSFDITCPQSSYTRSITLDQSGMKTVWVNALTGALNDPDGISLVSCNHISDYQLVARRVSISCDETSNDYAKEIVFCMEDVGAPIDIEVAAMDSEGNLSSTTCLISIRVKDGESPEISCITDTIIYLDSESITLQPGIFFTASDNGDILTFTGSGRAFTGSGMSRAYTGSGFTFDGAINSPFGAGNFTAGDVDFTCADTGAYELLITVIDESWNSNTCTVDVTIRDSSDICVPEMPFGMLLAEGVVPMVGAAVYLSDGITNFSTITDDDGQFELGNFDDASVLKVEVSFEDDWVSGITANDLFHLESYLTGLSIDNSMYTMVSADIDRSGQIDARDLVELKRILLNTISSDLQVSEPWSYFTNNSELDDLMNRNIDQDLSVDIVLGQTTQIVGTKLGDLDGDIINQLETRSTVKQIPMSLSEIKVTSTQMNYEITLGAGLSDHNALQLAMSIPNADNMKINNPNVSYSYINDELRIVYYRSENAPDDQIVISFSTTEYITSADIHLISSSDFANVAYQSDGVHTIDLSKTDVVENQSSLINWSVYPNPSSANATITFLNGDALANNKKSNVEVTVFDLLGREVLSIDERDRFLHEVFPIVLDDKILKGTYWIQITIDGKVDLVKYIKI